MKRESVKTVCDILAWLSVIGGVILGIYLAKEFGYDSSFSSYSYKIVKERNNYLTFMYFIIPTLAGIIEAIVFYALSTILNNQQDLLYKVNIIYNKETEKKDNDKIYKDTELPPL